MCASGSRRQANRKHDAIFCAHNARCMTVTSRVLEEKNAARGKTTNRAVARGDFVFSTDCYEDLATRGRMRRITPPRRRRADPKAALCVSKLSELQRLRRRNGKSWGEFGRLFFESGYSLFIGKEPNVVSVHFAGLPCLLAVADPTPLNFTVATVRFAILLAANLPALAFSSRRSHAHRLHRAGQCAHPV